RRPSMVSRRATLSIFFLTIIAAGISYPSARMLDRHAPPTAAAARTPMKPFASEEEILRFLEELGKRQRRQRRKVEPVGVADAVVGGIASPSPQQASPASSSGQAAPVSITNTRHAGVDEGDIVKVHGEHLVILRRGRIFTVAIADNGLTPVSSIDAFAPDIDPRRSWYDEMLVAGDAIVVIGYSYERGGTEIGLFDIDTKGNLSYRSTYHLRSNDYYSSRNYASRLLGSKLVFYAPLYIDATGPTPTAWLPALRRWRSGATDGDFQRIIEPSRVYPPFDDSPLLTLHTVTVCDLAHREMTCEATGVMGPPGRVFYVSPDSVYVWMTPWWHTAAARRSLLYCLPLDGSEPSALRARGAPIDQFSFLQSGDDHLNVLLRADAPGDTMWHAEGAARGVVLLRVPLTDLDGNAPEAAAGRYRALPSPDGGAFQNRFVGEYVLYGTGTTWSRRAPPDSDGLLYAYRFAGDDAPVSLPLGHAVDRIEAMGRDAIVVGGGGRDLYFTAVGLQGRPRLGGRFTEQAALQGELRSHGFFYAPDGDASGMFGLPVRSADQPGAARLRHDSAFVRYVRNRALNFSDAGRLVAGRDGARDDGCRASCVDWYGNTRPIFWRDRLFALLGYEIVEGRVDEGRVQEWRRVSFAPSRPRSTH
ncbi:MAG: beta-propeller domain-containing protein, partial [Vicinamibacteraceae bacterium]